MPYLTFPGEPLLGVHPSERGVWLSGTKAGDSDMPVVGAANRPGGALGANVVLHHKVERPEARTLVPSGSPGRVGRRIRVRVRPMNMAVR
jgi:hypothetical protein